MRWSEIFVRWVPDRARDLEFLDSVAHESELGFRERERQCRLICQLWSWWEANRGTKRLPPKPPIDGTRVEVLAEPRDYERELIRDNTIEVITTADWDLLVTQRTWDLGCRCAEDLRLAFLELLAASDYTQAKWRITHVPLDEARKLLSRLRRCIGICFWYMAHFDPGSAMATKYPRMYREIVLRYHTFRVVATFLVARVTYSVDTFRDRQRIAGLMGTCLELAHPEYMSVLILRLCERARCEKLMQQAQMSELLGLRRQALVLYLEARDRHHYAWDEEIERWHAEHLEAVAQQDVDDLPPFDTDVFDYDSVYVETEPLLNLRGEEVKTI